MVRRGGLISAGLLLLLGSCGRRHDSADAAPPTPPPSTRTWSGPVLIETENLGYGDAPQVSINAAGAVVATWAQSDGTHINVWSNRCAAGGAWGTAELLETSTDDAYSPRVAVTAAGDAFALWSQLSGSWNSAMTNRLVAGVGWAAGGAPIETGDLGNAGSTHVGVDSAGNAIAVWEQSDGTRNNIYANRYVVGTGWGTAAPIETENTYDTSAPWMKMDLAGNAVAVWAQDDGTRYNLWANRYVAGTGWGTAVIIETDNAGGVQEQRVAVGPGGEAFAVWAQSDGTRFNIWSNRFVPGSGWGTAAMIETDNNGDAGTPAVAVDASGNAIAAWYQDDGGRFNVYWNRYAPGSGWGTAQLLETIDAGDADTPQLAFDGSGNAIAVWTENDGTRNNIWWRRYAAGYGWLPADVLELDDTGDAVAVQVAVNAAGEAAVVWCQDDGSQFNIWADLYR